MLLWLLGGGVVLDQPCDSRDLGTDRLLQGRKLVANVDQREGNLLHLRLIDPSDPNAADDPLACLNADLVREGESGRVLHGSCVREDHGRSGAGVDAVTGLATVDKTCRYLSAYPQVIKKLEAGEASALPRRRLGVSHTDQLSFRRSQGGSSGHLRVSRTNSN